MKPSKKIILVVVAVILLGVVAAVLFLQRYTKVEISVRDRSNRPISRAEIVISRSSRAADITLYSNESGYAAKYLPLKEIGSIEVSRVGYAPAVLSGHLVTNRPVTIVLREWSKENRKTEK
ncbi:MAG: carboxypeptidase-like regulatory domain-containing protein [Proteobacteria bacterium]|nr:carboxypeptidase-like regulatory domain-containing protein [Pseudomonadota bacterium]MBU1739728.1 carboxypeptidase-like regulatory domain-containing protein [Pseudomonadota bacterium]